MDERNPQAVPYYFRSVDFEEMIREYPPAPAFFEGVFKLPPKEMASLQERRLRAAVTRAARVPFYQRLWKEADIGPDEIQTLDDLKRLPSYTVDDIRLSVESNPPFGDYLGLDPRAGTVPLRIHSSGGTTGEPRPTFYTPWDREVGSILRARSYYFHGLRPGDIVMDTLLFSTHNGAFTVEEALWLWLGCIPVTTSAGVVTRTHRALEIAQKWQVNAIVGFPEYVVHMAHVAKDAGIELNLKVIDTYGQTDMVKEAWGCPVYDTYGMHEVQTIASECPQGGGLHVWDDAYVVEVVDAETGSPLGPGEEGSLVVTALYKDAYPVVRYDTKDVTRLWPKGQCACGSWMRKIDPILGRADWMVKLRGVNVWPEACGAIVVADGRLTGEYYCVVERVGDRDEMTLQAEYKDGITDLDDIRAGLEQTLRDRLAVGIAVQLVESGSLASVTGVGLRNKARRLDDRRKHL